MDLDEAEALAQSWLDEADAEVERQLALAADRAAALDTAARVRAAALDTAARARAADLEALAGRLLEKASEEAATILAAARGQRAAAERDAAAILAAARHDASRHQVRRDLSPPPPRPVPAGSRSPRATADGVSTELGRIVAHAQATMPALDGRARVLSAGGGPSPPRPPVPRPVRSPFPGARPRRLPRLFRVAAPGGAGGVGRPGLEPGPEG